MPRSNDTNSTIAAISTPIGAGGIGIVRLSGRDSLKIADKIFLPKNGAGPPERRSRAGKPSGFKGNTVHYGWIVERSKIKEPNIVDEVLLTVMKAPRTYTKEDIVEINCHSGIVPLKRILDLTVSNGARIAQPGEFTKRAFLNGRIDLAQAEAVKDLINAKTNLASKAAFCQLEGRLSKKIKDIQGALLDALTHIEASLDFSEDEISADTNTKILRKLKGACEELTALLDTSREGIILREGIKCVICGRANVGKSTLMNALLKDERVIVTPIPGTTRDAVEEFINLKNIPVKLVDTAGIMKDTNEVDKQAISKTREHLESADIVLFMLDFNSPIRKDDLEVYELIREKQGLLVLNKRDLAQKIDTERLKRHFKNFKIIKVSAKKSLGLNILEDEIEKIIWKGRVSNSGRQLITNSRHRDCAARACGYLKDAIRDLEGRMSLEFVAVNLYASLRALGEVVGDVTTEDLLDKIFGQFCIGK